MVARDSADTPTEQFVPDFDDDVSDDEPDSPRETATTAGDAESSDDPETDAPAEPGPERSEHGEPSEIVRTQASRDTDPDDSDQPPDQSLADRDVSGGPDESVSRSETPDTPQKKLPDLVGLTVRVASPGLIRPAGPGHNGVVGGAARTAGALAGLAHAYRLIGWERAAAVGVLVLCTAVAGLLTGFAVVRATSDWTVTWGGTEQVDGRRPAPEGSRSAPPPQFDHPRYPASTNSVSPTPSVSASAPGPTASARPSRSPKPPRTPTPGVPPSGSPTATEPSPSHTGDPGEGG